MPFLSKSTRVFAIIAALFALYVLFQFLRDARRCYAPEALPLTPWQSIGGCGVVSSGGATGGSVGPWIGRGVTGTRVDFEAQAGTTFEQDENNPGIGAQESRILNLKAYTHFSAWDLSAALPLTWKIKGTGDLGGGGTQIGGIGDMSLEVQKKWCPTGAFRSLLGITLPTGKDDIYITKRNILPQSLQNGSGLYAVSVGMDYTIDREYGFLLFGAGYFAGLAYNKPTTYVYNEQNARVDASDFTPAWARKGWSSENDMAARFADIATLRGTLAIKQTKNVHGFSASLSVPFANNGYTEFLYGGTVDPAFAPSREQAQSFADTLTTASYIPTDTGPREVRQRRYENPKVLAKDYTGKWVVRDDKFHEQVMYPELRLGYSIELMPIENYPILLALCWPIRFGAGAHALYGFSVSAGLKIPAY